MKLLNITDQDKLNASVQFYNNLTMNNVNMIFLKNTITILFLLDLIIMHQSLYTIDPKKKYMTVIIWNSIL